MLLYFQFLFCYQSFFVIAGESCKWLEVVLPKQQQGCSRQLPECAASLVLPWPRGSVSQSMMLQNLQPDSSEQEKRLWFC